MRLLTFSSMVAGVSDITRAAVVSHRQQSADTKLSVLEKCSLPSIVTGVVANNGVEMLYQRIGSRFMACQLMSVTKMMMQALSNFIVRGLYCYGIGCRYALTQQDC